MLITRKRYGSRKGFTLVELMTVMIIVVIVGFAIGAVIVDAHNTWNTMYDRINSDIVTDGYVARKKFDSVIRSASRDKIFLAGDGSWIEVYCYADASSPVVDRYARFYVSGDSLNLEYGQLESRVTIDIETVCKNVSECKFRQTGTSAQMKLVLNEGGRSQTIVTSSVLQNK